MIEEMISAMGWSGAYPCCPCCPGKCPMKHLAPCVDKKHAEEGEKMRAADPEGHGLV